MPSAASPSRGQPTTRQALGWLSVVAVLALGGILAVRAGAPPRRPWLTEIARIELGVPVGRPIVGYDRRGAHLAAVSRLGGCFIVGWSAGELTCDRYLVPNLPSFRFSANLSFTDLTGDGLVDLLVQDQPFLVAPRRPGSPAVFWPTAVIAQQQAGFELVSIGGWEPVSVTPAIDPVVRVGGRDWEQITDSSGRPSQWHTRLRDPRSRRVGHVLRGTFVRQLDLDGDGHDEVLTESAVPGDRRRVEFRLYAYVRGRLRERWRGLGDGSAGWAVAAPPVGCDFDGDGLDELVLGELSWGRLRVFAYRPEP